MSLTGAEGAGASTGRSRRRLVRRWRRWRKHNLTGPRIVQTLALLLIAFGCLLLVMAAIAHG